MATDRKVTPPPVIHHLLELIEHMHEQCFREQTPDHQKKFMSMTLRQGKALRIISSLTMEKPEGVQLKHLAERMGMTVSATSVLVESMVVKGFFDRSVNPNDRRSVRIKLSQKGRENFERINHGFIKRFDQLFEGLTADERASFSEIVQKLYQHQFSARSKS